MEFVKEKFQGEPIIGAEIGVYSGGNALDILQSMPNIKLLYLIDPYEPYDEWRDRWKPGILDAKKAAESKIEPFKDRIIWIYKKTEDCDILPHPLDFIYIDGNHAYEFVKKDIEFAMKVTRPGGVIGGHDYRRGAKRAVDEFININNIIYNIYLYTNTIPKVSSDWWFIKP